MFLNQVEIKVKIHQLFNAFEPTKDKGKYMLHTLVRKETFPRSHKEVFWDFSFVVQERFSSILMKQL